MDNSGQGLERNCHIEEVAREEEVICISKQGHNKIHHQVEKWLNWKKNKFEKYQKVKQWISKEDKFKKRKNFIKKHTEITTLKN